MGENLYVVLGDVVSSQKIELRERLQRSLEDACRRVNTTYPQDIRADFKLLKGTDELGGVLSNIGNLFAILATLEDYIFPEQIRFAVTFGEVDLGLDSRDISKMDGPAFHRAARNMSELKETELFLRFSAEDPILDSAIEGEINLIFIIRQSWTDRQHEIVKAYEELQSHSKVADKLGVTHQTVSSTLKRAKWRSLHHIEKTLNEALLGYRQRSAMRQDIERDSSN
jgi:predicted DNA-binding protein YlxM (UPF0122 family)